MQNEHPNYQGAVTVQQNQQPTPVNPLRPHGQHVNSATVAIEESRAVAEVQAAIYLAKKFPRNMSQVTAKIQEACSRPQFAKTAMYAYPRAGQTVKGPSIRMAEELARCFTNIEYGIRELARSEGQSEMEAYCWDMENNVKSSQKFTVQHIMDTKQGQKKLTDMRDVYEITANQGGRRLRARILAVIPPDLVEWAIQLCGHALAGQSTEPMPDRVRKMVAAFAPFGVTVQHLEAYIRKPLDQLLIDELVDLQAIYNSLKDYRNKPSDFFTMPETTPASGSFSELNQALKQQQLPGQTPISHPGIGSVQSVENRHSQPQAQHAGLHNEVM